MSDLTTVTRRPNFVLGVRQRSTGISLDRMRRQTGSDWYHITVMVIGFGCVCLCMIEAAIMGVSA